MLEIKENKKSLSNPKPKVSMLLRFQNMAMIAQSNKLKRKPEHS